MSGRREERTIAALPFKELQCDAIVAMPISFNFMDEMIDCVRAVLRIQVFDLLGIPGFSKHFSNESRVILETINLAISKHFVKHIVIFQHVDFAISNRSARFKNAFEEDYFHKRGLFDSYEKLRILYPDVKVTLIYARLIKDESEIEFSKIYEDNTEEVCLRAPYVFKGVNRCENTVIQCLDYRFRSGTRICIQEGFNVNHFNIIGLPGSAKSFLENSIAAWKGVGVAYEEYDCRSFIVVHHEDCGAYKDRLCLADAAEQEVFHKRQLFDMKARLLERYSDVKITMLYIRLIANRTKMQFVLVE